MSTERIDYLHAQRHAFGWNQSKVGDRVIANGYYGTVTRTKDSPGSSWMGGMIEVRLASGTCCVSDYPPDVVPVSLLPKHLQSA